MERRNEARTMGTYRPVGREEQKNKMTIYNYMYRKFYFTKFKKKYKYLRGPTLSTSSCSFIA